jgi:DNA-binding NarL/FixJ family response regulator
MKILVVDDHALVRGAIGAVLEKLKRDASILEASDGRQAMRLVEQNPDLDLIVLDLNLPDRNGFQLLAELRERHGSTAVVVLSASNARVDIDRALRLGALGFIPKTTEREVLINALQLVFSGGIYIPPEILTGEPALARPCAAAHETAASVAALGRDLGLTGRQVEVLALIMEGKSNKAIAHLLEMAESTAKNHVTAVLKALKVANRTEAVVKMGKMGWQRPATTGSAGGGYQRA